MLDKTMIQKRKLAAGPTRRVDWLSVDMASVACIARRGWGGDVLPGADPGPAVPRLAGLQS